MITAFIAALLFHPGGVPSALSKVGSDGSVSVRIRFNVLAYVLDQTTAETSEASLRKLVDLPEPDLEGRLNDARTRFQQALEVRGSNAPIKTQSVEFPKGADIKAAFKEHGHVPMLLPVTAKAKLPSKATTFSLRFPDLLDAIVLTVERDGYEPYSEKLKSGQSSKPVPIQIKD